MDSRKEDNRKHWEWGRYFSIVTMLALAPMRLDCVFLLPKLQSGLFQYVQLISFQLFLNSVRSALTVPHSGPQFWHLPHTAEPLLWVEADWRPSAVLKWQAWGCSLSSFPTTVVSHSQIPSWESYVILDGACYCCTRPEVLCGQGQGGGVECGSLLGAAWFLLQPGLAGVSRCCWTGSLLVKAVFFGFFWFFFCCRCVHCPWQQHDFILWVCRGISPSAWIEATASLKVLGDLNARQLLFLTQMDAVNRSCTVSVHCGNHRVRMLVMFPVQYPNNAAPSFQFINPTSITASMKAKLLKVRGPTTRCMLNAWCLSRLLTQSDLAEDTPQTAVWTNVFWSL